MDNKVFKDESIKSKYTDIEIISMIILSVFFLLILLLRTVSIKYIGKEVESIKIEVETNQIGISKEMPVKITVKPQSADTTNLKWNISNPNIIKIEENKIIGKELGKTTISLESDKVTSNKLEISCVTYISEAKIKNPIDKLSAFKDYPLDVEVFPEEATNKEFKVVSANPEIIEIKENNVLYGKKTGKTTIFVKDTFGKTLAEMEIEVIWIKIKAIDIDEKELKLGIGQKSILYANIEPLNATNLGIIWESENPDIASIDEHGVITGKNPGIVKITGSVKNEDKKSECLVSVTAEKQLGTFLYSSGEYNINYAPLYQSETIVKTKYFEQIEFLHPLEKEGWVKVRNSEGIPGFIEYRKNRFLKDKPKLIENVRYISNKDINMSNGSLIASAMMILENKGYTVSAYNLLYRLPKVAGIKNDKIEASPYDSFIGNPESNKEDGSYTGFDIPATKMITYHLGDIVNNITGVSEEEILKNIDNNKPVLVWTEKDGDLFRDGKPIDVFKSGIYIPKSNIVTGVLVGYDDENLYIHNPEKHAFTKCNREVFFKNFESIKRPAITIK